MSKRIWKLLLLNMVYGNPKSVVSKKGTTSSLNRKALGLLASYPILAALALLLAWQGYATFQLVPIMYYFQTLSFTLIGIGLTLFYSYSTFFQSRDFEHYLYYPFTKGEVFYGKVFTNFIMFSPIFVFAGAASFSFGLLQGGIVPAIMQTLMSIAILLASFVFNMMIVFYIGTNKKTQKFSSILLGIGLLILIGGSMAIGLSAGLLMGVNSETATVSFNIPALNFLNVYTDMLKENSLLLIIPILILTLLSFAILYALNRRAMVRYVDAGLNVASKKKGEVTFLVTGIKKAMFKHNWNLISVNKQYLSMIAMMTFMPILYFTGAFFAVGEEVHKVAQAIDSAALFFIGGAVLIMLIGLYPISENLYSLERENLEYMIALPLSRKFIYRQKQRFAIIVTSIPIVIYSIILVIALHASILNISIFFVSAMLFNGMYQTYFLIQDNKAPNVNWSTEMDLLQGGLKTFTRVVRMYGVLILGVALIVFFAFMRDLWLPQLILIIVLYMVGIYLCYRREKKYGF